MATVQFDFSTMINVTIGVVMGGIITYLVAWCYYRRAAKDLKDTAAELGLVSQLIIYKLQYPDMPTEIVMNDAGHVSGLKFKASGTSTSKSTVKGTLTDKNSTKKSK